MIKVGVCCFDDVSDAKAGWASVAGAAARRIKGHGDLRTDVLWVTNLPYKYYQKMNFITSPHIYDTQFFRTSLDQIAKENGLENNEQELSEFAAYAFDKLAQMGNKHLKQDLSSPGYRYHKLLSYALIPEYARKRPEGRNAADIFEAIQDSTQANQSMTGVQKPPGVDAVSFVFPRLPYAQWILSQKYPSGKKWQEIKQKNESSVFGFEDGKFIRNTKSVLNRLSELSAKHAIFMRVNVESMDPFYQKFASFGASGNFNKRNSQKLRKWATLPEIVEMSRYAKLEILGGYMTPYSEEPLVDPEMLKGTGMSYAHGLFLENIWSALCAPVGSNPGSAETIIGAYMRAYDRLACGRAAAEFSKSGFIVGSYSMGRIIAFIRQGEGPISARMAFEAGMLPPMKFLNTTE